ncbi:MAG: UDP-N-acetylglucosamine 4-epimerase [Calditrichaeota bacterium]|nr:UDP-N-acetylglucosamine 4-epimerase [Calditrichota bacterium]
MAVTNTSEANRAEDRVPVLVTGSAGFIGFHLARRLLESGRRVIGVDNLNDYYDVALKEARTELLAENRDFSFIRMDLEQRADVGRLFAEHGFREVVHMAAQAGVRYSLVNPRAYLDANLIAFFNVLDACRHNGVRHFVYASSSSVYGLNTRRPFSVHDNVDHPISLYAASKKANELLAHTYSNLYQVPSTGLRFFTVYGPWGRPDMALFRFCRAIFLGEPLTLYNHGEMERDFTYVDDIVDGVLGVLDTVPAPNPDWQGSDPDPGTSPGPYRVYNIGAGRPIHLRRFLELIETYIGRTTEVRLAPMQPGDVPATYADISDLNRDTGYDPKVPVEEGIRRFVEWFLDYYGRGRKIPDS